MRLLGIVAVLAVVAVPLAMADPVRGTTSGESLDVLITPGSASFVMEFLKPSTDNLQEHVDYTVEVTNDGTQIFGPIRLTHTTPGKVTIPAALQDGTNEITITVRGILFVPINDETLTIQVVVGEEAIPSWVRTNAGWWVDGQIDDTTFLTGVQYLIENGIISVQASSSGGDSTGSVPEWIKTTAGLWVDGQISDSEFLNALTYMIENGIISVTVPADAGPLIIAGVDLSRASPRLGSADASVTIIEFGDYQCPRCKSWFDSTKPQLDTNYINTGVVKLYFVDVKYIGGDSHTAAMATYCAQDQGMYWKYHDILYKRQKGVHDGWASVQNLVGFAGDIGLDTTEFEACLQSGEQMERLDFNAAQGRAQGVAGTPHFIIAGPGGPTHIAGPQPYSTFDNRIQEMLN